MVLAAERDIGERLRSANRLDPDRLPRLKALGTEWAEGIGAFLSRRYASRIQVDFAGLSLLEPEAGGIGPDLPAHLALASSPAWNGPVLCLVDERFADVVIEGMCGGDGRRPSSGDRPATAFDKRLMRVALDVVLDAGNVAMQPVLPAAMSIERLVSTRPQEALFSAMAGEMRAFVEFAFRFSLGRAESRLRVAVPEAVLAPHRRKLVSVPEQAAHQDDEDWARDIQEGLQHADMQLRAILDEKQTTLGAVASFTLGQTIVLDAHVDSLVVVECEEQRLFRGRMGRDRDSYLVRIEEAVDPTQEFIDDILSH